MSGRWIESPLPEEAERIAKIVRACAIAVHREVGPGFRENIYQRCLAHALRQAGLRVEERVKLSVRFRDLELPNAAEADLIVEGFVVVELKARETVHQNHIAQLRGYLLATNLPIGLLFNFHAPILMRQGYERVVHPRYLVLDGQRLSSRVHGSSGPRV